MGECPRMAAGSCQRGRCGRGFVLAPVGGWRFRLERPPVRHVPRLASFSSAIVAWEQGQPRGWSSVPGSFSARCEQYQANRSVV